MCMLASFKRLPTCWKAKWGLWTKLGGAWEQSWLGRACEQSWAGPENKAWRGLRTNLGGVCEQIWAGPENKAWRGLWTKLCAAKSHKLLSARWGRLSAFHCSRICEERSPRQKSEMETLKLRLKFQYLSHNFSRLLLVHNWTFTVIFCRDRN